MNQFFELIVTEHQDAVFGFLFSLVRDRHQAEDLAQETFLVLLRKIDMIDASRPVLPWLLTTARNLAMNALRKRAVEQKVFVSGEVAQGLWERLGSKDLGNDWAGRLKVLRQCREKLSDAQKETVDLYYQEGRSSQDIADTLGTAVAAVYNRLARGRAALRRCIERKLEGAG